jgi:hypothetical protein
VWEIKGGANMKRLLIAGILVVVMAMVMPNVVFATDVTITASPSFLEFGSTPTTWTLNGITGSGKIDENTTYYSNPLGDTTEPSATVADADCYFTWSNNSSVNIEITVNCGSFTGGDADMTNSNAGTNGATTYGAHSWYSGMTYSGKKIVKSSGSDVLYTTSTPGEDKKWGAEIITRTDTWTGSSNSTATMTITVAEA